VVVCCVLRAATVTAKALQQSALAARSHAHARAGRAGAGRTSAGHGQVKPATARGRAKWGAGRTSPSPQCRLLSWASPGTVRAVTCSHLLRSRVVSRALLHAEACSRSDCLPPRRALFYRPNCMQVCSVAVWRCPCMTVSVFCGPCSNFCAAPCRRCPLADCSARRVHAERLVGAPCARQAEGRRRDGERQCTRSRRSTGQTAGARRLRR